MKRFAWHIIFVAAVLFNRASANPTPAIAVSNLKCEMLVNPRGIDIAAPRFSWWMNSGERNLQQVAYEILIASSEEKLSKNTGDVWTSGRVNSDRSNHVPYEGRPLKSRQQCFWKVRIWTNQGESHWSETATFSMGLLQPADWKAKWIGLDRAFPWDSVTKFARLSARYFRKEINAQKQVRKATVYISGLGLYELHINGQKIGDQVLAPAPTDYSKTVLYNTFDVTRQVKQGRNAIGVILGNGRFFTMRQNYKPQKWHNFGFPRMIVQLEIEYNDGSSQLIGSDETWKVTADGPIRTNNEYDGEEYDATKELTGWDATGYNDAQWMNAEIVKAPGGKMKAQMNPPMKVMEEIRPLSIKQVGDDKYLLDMGQNMAGWLKMQVKGKKGASVKLRFAESLQPGGQLYVANLRDAMATDIYTMKGEEKETWHPTFVYHGFRYVEITGLPGPPEDHQFWGEVVYDDLRDIGSLETSNSTINTVHHNAYWGIRSNYKGMPIDCPQRNERQPWLGDRTMGAYGESFLFDNEALYVKWLDDIADAQTDKGSIPDVAPNFWYYYKDNMTWPGAFLTIADMLYRQYGNPQPVVKHYPAMKKWMDYMKGQYLKNYIMNKDSYGDWCVPPESPELIHSKDPARTTDPKLIATAYYYYFLNVMQNFAMLSSNKADIQKFADEAVKVKAAFNREFYNADCGCYSNNTVTANLLPLVFKIVSNENEEKVFQQIVERIMVKDEGHISTGVVGTQWLMRWLTKYNRADIAFKLASNTTYPSWGYMAQNGATTIWELWNGNTANPAMNSQNHVMLLGDLLIWMYENLGGIQSDTKEAGFKKIIMKPSLIEGLSFANASYTSPYGKIESSWKKESDRFMWSVTVPGNATALVYIPAGAMTDIREGGNAVNKMQGIQYRGTENGRVVLEIGSGTYQFSSKLDRTL